MNELEQALEGTNSDLDSYLANTDTETIRSHIQEIKNKSNDLAKIKMDLIRFIQKF